VEEVERVREKKDERVREVQTSVVQKARRVIRIATGSHAIPSLSLSLSLSLSRSLALALALCLILFSAASSFGRVIFFFSALVGSFVPVAPFLSYIYFSHYLLFNPNFFLPPDDHSYCAFANNEVEEPRNARFRHLLSSLYTYNIPSHTRAIDLPYSQPRLSITFYRRFFFSISRFIFFGPLADRVRGPKIH
jgi:hypothetical protein